jgi:NAD(P)-dependent dehydrogenase (short-subunit alcohol dehydrogenase family)
VQHLIDQTVSTFGRLDILVNNAGVEFKHPFLEFPLDLWHKIIGTYPFNYLDKGKGVN